MKIFRMLLILTTAAVLLIGSKYITAQTSPLSAAMLAELARARAATAKYHDIAQAEADGYVSLNFCEPGEGCHWVKPALIDGFFDPEKPEILLYAPGPGNNGLRLVAVEYIVPLGLSPAAPQGFTSTLDTWRQDTEGAGLWELTTWIWLSNPNGMFEQHNPKIP